MVVTEYRMPHMTLPEKHLNIIFVIVYMLVFALAISEFSLHFNAVTAFGATLVPL